MNGFKLTPTDEDPRTKKKGFIYDSTIKEFMEMSSPMVFIEVEDNLISVSQGLRSAVVRLKVDVKISVVSYLKRIYMIKTQESGHNSGGSAE